MVVLGGAPQDEPSLKAELGSIELNEAQCCFGRLSASKIVVQNQPVLNQGEAPSLSEGSSISCPNGTHRVNCVRNQTTGVSRAFGKVSISNVVLERAAYSATPAAPTSASASASALRLGSTSLC